MSTNNPSSDWNAFSAAEVDEIEIDEIDREFYTSACCGDDVVTLQGGVRCKNCGQFCTVAESQTRSAFIEAGKVARMEMEAER